MFDTMLTVSRSWAVAFPAPHHIRNLSLLSLLAIVMFAVTGCADDEPDDQVFTQSKAKVQIVSDTGIAGGFSATSKLTAAAAAENGCNLEGGYGEDNLIDSVGVPAQHESDDEVESPIRLRLRVFETDAETEPNDIYYKVSIINSNVVKFSPPIQEKKVRVPANTRFTDAITVVGGKNVGETFIKWKREPDPVTKEEYFSSYTKVTSWKILAEDIVDYNSLGASNVCYDENSQANPPPLVTDINLKASCGARIEKVATDGVSHLLFRLKSGGAGRGCFKIYSGDITKPDGTKDWGGVFFVTKPSDESPEKVISEQQEPFKHWIFAGFTPTDDFYLDQSQDERIITVEIAYTPLDEAGGYSRNSANYVRKEIRLTRPPVLMVHGVWSDMDTWSQLYDEATPLGWITHRFDYSPTNSAQLQTNADNLGHLTDGGIAAVLKKARNKKIAATKVDIVAHSMGNLMTRSWMSGDSYIRPNNYRQGDVRKLVSLTAPYLGSLLSNMLINLHANFADSVPPHKAYTNTIKRLGNKRRIDHGAVCDMAEGSPLLNFDEVPNVKGYVFTATAGPPNDHLALFHLAYKDFTEVEKQIHIYPYIFGEANDGLVSEYSQMGGTSISRDNRTNHALKHFSSPGKGITKSELVAEQVFNALNGSDSFKFSDSLPQISSSGWRVPIRWPDKGRPTNDQQNHDLECIPGVMILPQ